MEKETLNVRNVDKEQKRKAIFILSTKGKTLSDAVREMVKQYADEFDQKK